jgi:hypothetical protein
MMNKETWEEGQKSKKVAFSTNVMNMYDTKARKWFVNRGKAKALDFTNDEIKNLKECFNALDEDKGGSIGLEELEDPLIGLGLAESTEKVE